MNPWIAVLVPFAAGAAALAVPDKRRRPWFLPAGCVAHALCVAGLSLRESSWGGWIGLDPIGMLVLGVSTLLFLLCSINAVEFLAREDRENRLFCACFLFMLSAVTLVCLSRHMGLLWVGMDALTLAAAPLIYFERTDRSLEATWKYLILGSVGIGLALLGTFFLAIAGLAPGYGADPLLLDELVRRAPELAAPWLRGAFVFLLVGYGTKMGLAPMHTWLPDAHSEAPSVVSALLSGVMLNAAFVGILRGFQVCDAAGQATFARGLLVLTGLLSIGTAAVFMLRQKDFKRLLAYSSVEHMGILVLGIGVGGAGPFAAMLHLINHAFAKGLLFLTAGNIYHAYGAKTIDRVRGALRRVPVSASLFLAGVLAITGSPPFGPFISELTLLRAAASRGRWVIVVTFAGLMAVVFIGMAATALAVVQGRPLPESDGEDGNGNGNGHGRLESWGTLLAPALFAAALLFLGLCIPQRLAAGLLQAAALVGGVAP